MGYFMVFDTETTGLDKPFCYDIGYAIVNDETQQIELQRHFIVEQIWHNLPLFESAYYKDKRPIYVKLLRAKKATMDKWGYIMGKIKRDCERYLITDAYAYNSNFDDNVISFNCDWFKTINPFDDIAIHDIWGYVSSFISNTPEYTAFCEENSLFTDTGNYSASAENVFRFLSNNTTFTEEHMGLYDVHIETAILLYCINHDAEYCADYPVKRVLPRPKKTPFTIKVNGVQLYSGEYVKKNVRNNVYSFQTI